VAPYIAAIGGGGGTSPNAQRMRKNSHNDVEKEKRVRNELNPSSGNSPQFSTSMPAQFNFLAHGNTPRDATMKYGKDEYSSHIINTDHAHREDIE